jgi:tRNA-specific 2-thiouridylase
MVLVQGIELEAVMFVTPFCQRGKGGVDLARLAKEIGVKLRTIDLLEECVEVVKNPKHGYGSNMNPCIDCKILMLRKAKAMMGEVDASFVVTGEVLGQRPMSQHKEALRIIAEDSGLDGLVLRPLSAKSLPPTRPEEEGWVKRELLLSIRGRSRREQIELATRYGISGYAAPSGGCLLTDPSYARRLIELLGHCQDPSLNDIELLKIGRHFRISRSAKLVVGRNREENDEITRLCSDVDILFEVPYHNCPISIARGHLYPYVLSISARIEARYSDAPQDEFVDVMYHAPDGRGLRLSVRPATDEELSPFRIG